jgi:2'-5' RNA ligase
MPSIETALVVLVPEAEALVRPFRDQHDPSAAAGMPAHITLLYPFKPPNEIDDATLENLRRCFRRFAPIRFSLGTIRRFPVEVLYLAPNPDGPFRQLTLAIWDAYPETPPYGGKWSDIVPHLSVACLKDDRRLDRITSDLVQASRGKLPIQATASEVALMDNQSGRWRVSTKLSLGREL